ncbi:MULTISPECIES: tetratricopeptide repeat protein [Methylobacterium]|uniref:Sel1 repeat family protein n=1 Tax=Methylobacterium thuringiense TaxID=1003091 RepID=A0ABQ4TKY4_9HYPH|nr:MULTISPECIES: tetratricopeptide repeat protein [Methylobacterium]TXN25109.1 sel1 repeat family protein [Methylobacterium sp. WL9]GJE54690.1 hypothetical protein EKPJFOCH_1169 [Methylobacterium thuringiense]
MTRVGAGLFALALLASPLDALAAPNPPSIVPPTMDQTLKSVDPKVAPKGFSRDLPTPYTPNAEGLRPASTANADMAYGAYQRGRYKTAFREASKRIETNPKDAAALTLLGELYNQGLGVKQDPKRALEWYRLAAGLGDAHAMASLGLMAMDGRGQAKDQKAGKHWLEQASEKGEASASYNLALLQLSSGKPEDVVTAAALFEKAAKTELAPAQHDLGVLYLQGRGVAKDPAKAADYFRRAADNGDLAGEVEFAILLFNGTGVAKDEARAARYFLHAAARGNAIAQNRVARLYVVGRGVNKNLVEAGAWNLAAAAQGLSDAWLDQSLTGLTKEDRTRAEALGAERAKVQP